MDIVVSRYLKSVDRFKESLASLEEDLTPVAYEQLTNHFLVLEIHQAILLKELRKKVGEGHEIVQDKAIGSY